MSSRTAAANSFSLTNYKIPLLCNACKYLRHVLSNSQSNFQTTNHKMVITFFLMKRGLLGQVQLQRFPKQSLT